MATAATCAIGSKPTSYRVGSAGWERYWSGRMERAAEVWIERLSGGPYDISSRRAFATVLGVDTATHRAWETGEQQIPKAVMEFARLLPRLHSYITRRLRAARKRGGVRAVRRTYRTICRELRAQILETAARAA